MKINGGIRFVENGITASIRAMHVDSELISVANENVNGFDKVGYQRKDAVVSSLTEFLGVHGLSTTVDDKVGRINISENPLDISLAAKGYFQTESKEGIKITRDGRFKIDKEGNLLTLDDSKVLSNTGMPIKLHVVPEDMKHIKINDRGLVSVFNPNSNKLESVAYLGIVDTNGALIMEPKVKQGYNEYSNVSLQEEFIGMMPIIKNFDANRQLFMIQNQNLQKVISQLGSAT
ncbi:flagellar hook basal-body protein [bacterium]|nr:flagellar hook basal-body protein [bacterium]